jgi:hypothetical protein
MIITINDNIKKEFLEYHGIKFFSYSRAFSSKIRQGSSKQKIHHLNCEFQSEKIISSSTDSFVYAVHLAYRYHVPLVITPDIIWYLIASAAGIHINLNETLLRAKFVDFKEKEKIIITKNDFPINQSNHWDRVIDELCINLKNRTKNYISEKIESNFSTSNKITKTVSKIVLTNSMSKCFEYGHETSCGIPEIHISGNKQDWLDLKNKAHFLIELLPGLEIWLKSLDEILNNFINAFENKIDLDFWNQIYKQINRSGGPYLSGWVIALFPYLAEDKKNDYIFSTKNLTWRDSTSIFGGLKTSSFAFKLNCVPFKWLDNNEITMNFIGGLIGIRYDENDSKLLPVFGYAVTEDV